MAIQYYLSEWERNMTGQPLSAEGLLRGLGATGKLIGFRYAIHIIASVAEDPTRMHLITKRLYPEVAQEFGTTPSAVERAVRNLIYSIWNRGDRSCLERVAGARLMRPPTNGEFIDMLAGYLRNHR